MPTRPERFLQAIQEALSQMLSHLTLQLPSGTKSFLIEEETEDGEVKQFVQDHTD